MPHQQRGQEHAMTDPQGAAQDGSAAWAATSLAGTIVMSFHYASTAAFYCPASTVKGSLTGTPA